MGYKLTAKAAADWALAQVGCSYSQANRTKEKIFDCSSLIARAYSAQEKRWRYGGGIPTSNKEVYDDDFELLWPATYAEIGQKFGGKSAINLAKQPGDLQFLCTDAKTSRSNKITHVTMVISESKIVHARGTKYGVRTDSIDLYNNKVCAVMRYNPSCALRLGIKGFRTLALQNALNEHGADLNPDGEFGSKSREALIAFQKSMGLKATGETNDTTLAALELAAEAKSISDTGQRQLINNKILVTGGSVNIRTGPGTKFPSVTVVHADDVFEGVDVDGWQPILLDGEVRWISGRYCKVSGKMA